MSDPKARATMAEARERALKALAIEALPASALGFTAFPDAKIRSAQGAALAAGRLIRELRDDGLICASGDRRYCLTSKGRALTQEPAKC